MTEKEIEKLKTLEKVETGNEGFEKNGWKILDVYRTINKAYTKYALIECLHCKNTKLVTYYGFIKEDQKASPCTKCGGSWIDWAQSMIGQIVGHYKILEYVDLIKRKSNNKVDVFFKVQCIHCGKIRNRELFSNSGWNRYEKCPDCPRFVDSYLEKRYKEYVSSANKRSKDWNLSYNEFIKIGTSNCYYCGEKPTYQSRIIGDNEIGDYFTGIDRVDSNKGYSIDNCVPCCTICNQMKLNYSLSEFLQQINKIYNHSTKLCQTTIENTSNKDGSE